MMLNADAIDAAARRRHFSPPPSSRRRYADYARLRLRHAALPITYTYYAACRQMLRC